ncbi:MAG: hypothetical protein LBK99_23070 [Opitutaceae bacterium]|nr:hypothetical protein [Opitutaceae bacterium]
MSSEPPKKCPDHTTDMLLAGLAGAAIADIVSADDKARRVRELEQERKRLLQTIEDERLRLEKERNQLHAEQALRARTEDDWRHAVLWLERCDNEQRLDYIVSKNSGELLAPCVKNFSRKVLMSQRLTPLFSATSAAASEFHRFESALKSNAAELGRLENARFKPGLLLLIIAIFTLTPTLLLYGATSSPWSWLGVVVFLVFAAIVPRIIENQKIPPDEETIPNRIQRLEIARDENHRAAKTALRKLTEAAAILQTGINDYLPQAKREAGAPDDIAQLREAIGKFQERYPPAVRCGLSAFTDGQISSRFAAAFEDAFHADFPESLSSKLKALNIPATLTATIKSTDNE